MGQGRLEEIANLEHLSLLALQLNLYPSLVALEPKLMFIAEFIRMLTLSQGTGRPRFLSRSVRKKRAKQRKEEDFGSIWDAFGSIWGPSGVHLGP